MNLMEKAEAAARKAHEGQFRRDGVTPYITHPERVVARLMAQGITDDATLAAGWLHDVVEDTGHWEYLDDMLPTVIVLVGQLTKHPGDTYDYYLHVVNRSPKARIVKIADILDNLSDNPTEKQILKYCKALLYLHGQ